MVRRNVKPLVAKRAVEAMIDRGVAYVRVPTIESKAQLANELHKAGVVACGIAEEPVDVRALREREGLTQEQFATRYAIDLATLQNWEQGRNQPEATANAYLRVIASNPLAAAMAQETELSR